MSDYNTHSRRRYIIISAKRFGLGTDKRWSLKRIAYAIKEHFDLPKPPATATIANDLAQIEKDKLIDVKYSEEAERLLEPDNFSEWRSTMFRAPGNREYLTPKHQLAWFYLVRTLALKEVPPEWVVDYLMLKEQLPEDLDLMDWAENPDKMLNLFLLAPPRHGKSDLAAHVIIWLICRNPDIRILWCGGKIDISTLTTNFIRNELEANEKLIEYYGPFENDGDWAIGQFTVATRKTRMRSPTLRAVAKGTTILSLDADIIFADDIFDLKASESPTQVGKDVRWVKSQLMTRRENWTPLFGIGSHQPSPTGDAYDYMETEHDNEIYFVKQKAHDYTKCKPKEGDMTEEERHGDWCLMWSDVRNYGYLEQMRKTLGDIMYEVCYNQDNRQSTIAYFRDKVIRGDYPQPVVDPDTGTYKEFNAYEQKAGILDRNRSIGWPVKTCCGGRGTLRTVMGFDPASSQNRGTSESALIVLQGCTNCRRRYLLDLWHKRQSPELHAQTLETFAAEYKPQRLRIEVNAYQLALARDKELKRASLEHHFLIDEWFTGDKKRDPQMGIPLLARHMEQGRFSIPYSLPQDRDKVEPLLAQLIRFPSEPNDLVMALWLADLSLEKIMDSYLVTQPRSLYDDVPAYLQRQLYVVDTME